MANCKNCFSYTVDNDELMRRRDDRIVVGRRNWDRHFCWAFQPIPEGVFEGPKDCPHFYERSKMLEELGETEQETHEANEDEPDDDEPFDDEI